MPAPSIETPVLSLEYPALAELARNKQWVCWKYVERDGEWTKAPIQASGIGASSTNPHTWGGLSSVSQAALIGGYGIGYVFNGDVVGVDLDKCRNPKTGEIEPWAKEIADRLNSYTEISPSGRGLHVLLKGPIPQDGRRRGNLEVYTRGRYFTMTGRHLAGTPEDIRENAEGLAWLWETHIGAGKPFQSGGVFTEISIGEFPWDKFDILMEADPKFRASWLHKRPEFEDQSNSVYDCSIVHLASNAGWTDEELAALVLQHRKKWGGVEKAHRKDYVSKLVGRVKQASRNQIEGAESPKAVIGRVMAEMRADDIVDNGQVEALNELRIRLRLPVKQVIITGENTAIGYGFIFDDGRRIDLGNAGSVLNQASFRRTIFAAEGVVVPQVKQPVWDATITILQAAADREDAADSDPVRELTGAIEEYVYNAAILDWNDEEAPTAFAEGDILRRDGCLMIAVRHFHRWCLGQNLLVALDQEQIRGRLRLAGWKGADISRRVHGKVVRRTYWISPSPCNSETVE